MPTVEDTPLDTRLAENTLEDAIHDAILYSLGRRLPPVASIAALRALPSIGPGGTSQFDDDFLICISGSPVLSFRWHGSSTATDDGSSVVQPSDVVGLPGRWLAWTSVLRFSPVVGDNDTTLDQLTSGTVQRVLVLDKDMSEQDMLNLIAADIPAVFIVAEGDRPADATLMTGHRWLTAYDFTIMIVEQNLRGDRRAAQGSDIANDPNPGANALDGHIKTILSGTNLTHVVGGIRTVQLGPAKNWVSVGGQRRVVRQRDYVVIVSEEFPNAPNDIVAADEVDVTQEMAAPAADDTVDTANYVVAGCLVPLPPVNLSCTVAAGQAVIGGVVVNYAGGSHVFPAWSDVYHDLAPGGVMTFTAVGRDLNPPAVAPGSLRIGVSRTNGVQVFASVYVAMQRTPYSGPWVIDL